MFCFHFAFHHQQEKHTYSFSSSSPGPDFLPAPAPGPLGPIWAVPLYSKSVRGFVDTYSMYSSDPYAYSCSHSSSTCPSSLRCSSLAQTTHVNAPPTLCCGRCTAAALVHANAPPNTLPTLLLRQVQVYYCCSRIYVYQTSGNGPHYPNSTYPTLAACTALRTYRTTQNKTQIENTPYNHLRHSGARATTLPLRYTLAAVWPCCCCCLPSVSLVILPLLLRLHFLLGLHLLILLLLLLLLLLE